PVDAPRKLAGCPRLTPGNTRAAPGLRGFRPGLRPKETRGLSPVYEETRGLSPEPALDCSFVDFVSCGCGTELHIYSDERFHYNFGDQRVRFGACFADG